MQGYRAFGVSEEALRLADQLEMDLQKRFKEIERVRDHCQLKVLKAFQNQRVSETDFGISRGYGYDDAGRDKLERVYAEVFGTESALVRISLLSGTMAISTVLFGLLRPGDELLAVSGKPYDTLDAVIGLGERKDEGSLRSFGVTYREVALLEDGRPDLLGIRAAISERTKVVHIQRSRGYAMRRALSIQEIQDICETVHELRKDLIVFVDNCYGEFVEEKEPGEVGADIIAGSLIKNPGGGLAPSGGYICGRQDLVHQCACRYSAPGLGAEVGASLGYNRLLYQGLYLAPHVVAESLRGAVFASAYLQHLGYQSDPGPWDHRSDIVQLCEFKEPKSMCAFIEAIQAAAPVDSFVRPTPAPMPGYEDPVIMAAGAFVQGASIELSADGPLRPPYTVFMQGGLVYANIKLAVLMADQRIRAEQNEALT